MQAVAPEPRDCCGPAREALAADALQDVLVGLLARNALEGVSGDARRLRAYLRGAVRRRGASLRRRESRYVHDALDHLPLASRDSTEQQERGSHVHAALAHLRANNEPAAADLLEWRFLDGLSVEVIAARLGKAPTSISAQLQRAKKKFLVAWLAVGGDF